MSARFAAASLATLFASLCTVAAAQGTGVPAAPADPQARPQPAPPEPGSRYRSAFEGYRGYADQPVLPWREANDLVGRIGGWQAYAREAQAEPTGGKTSPPAASRPGPDAAPSSVTPGGHDHHPRKP